MSRRFTSSAQSLKVGSAILTAPPLTMACWSKRVTTSSIVFGMMSIVNGSTDGFLLCQSNTTLLAASRASSTSVQAQASVTADGTWIHVAGVFNSSTSRLLFMNGVQKASNSTSNSPSGLSDTEVGVRGNVGNVNGWSGHIAECAIWNIALTNAEVLLLAQGVLPSQVRPQNLVAYWPLRTPGVSLEFDQTPWSKRRYDLTVTGATPAPHL